MASSPAVRRYNRRALLLFLGYAAALIGANLVFQSVRPVGMVAYLVAVAPALPIVGVFAAVGRYLHEESDEYLRLTETRHILAATGLTLSLATAWGFVESFGLAPHIPAYFIAIVWYGALGVAACIGAVRERWTAA